MIGVEKVTSADIDVSSLVMDVQECSRCGERHEGLKVKRFSRGPLLDSAKEPYPFFVTCPTLEEPVLIRFKDEAKGHFQGESFSRRT